MAGLVPAIHVVELQSFMPPSPRLFVSEPLHELRDVDARDKPGHDDEPRSL